MPRYFTINDLLVFLAVVIWGLTNTLVRFALQEISPLTFLGIRTVLTSLFMLFLLWVVEKKVSIRRADLWPFLLIGFFGYALFQFFYTVGFYYTTASLGSMILTTSPLYGVMISLSCGMEKANRKVFGGILISILGVALILSEGLADSLRLSGLGLGNLLMMGGAVSFAVCTVFAKPLLASNSPLKVNTLSAVSGTIFLLPLTLRHLGPSGWLAASPAVWSILIFSVVITAGLSLTLWFRGVSRIGPTKTQIYQNLVPATTIAFAVPLLGETVSALQVLGAVIAILGISIARRG